MDKAGEREGKERKAGERRAPRQERLAAALRENLRRRKTQTRARKKGAGSAGGADPDGEPA